MTQILLLLVHVLVLMLKLIQPQGVKKLVAENLSLKQQLLVLKRKQRRAANFKTQDRFILGLLAFFIDKKRLSKIAVICQPATILRFHQALVKCKYAKLFSSKHPKKRGRKGPGQSLVELVIEMKLRNPRFGYLRIALQLNEAFGIDISPEQVGRILKKHRHRFPSGDDRAG